MVRKLRVMFVEDERILALMLRAMLVDLGVEVCGYAPSGEEALAQFPAAGPDLLLMDVRLAGAMDGIDTAQSIRALRDVPVVFLSAYSDAPTLERMRAAGASAILSKPIDQESLGQALRQFISRG